MLKIHLIAGARPNLIKVAPLLSTLEIEKNIDVKFIYTGQHYDKNLFTEILFDMNIRRPDINFKIGLGSPNFQISKIIKKYNKYLEKNIPDLIIVFGDVNSTLAAAITAKKNNIKLAHVEAGLRCYDDSLPEEVNRRLTDSISDYLFTPSVYENKNLLKENIKKKVFCVGNIMIDSLIKFLSFRKNFIQKYKNIDGVLTLHRPENVDNKRRLIEIISELKEWTKYHKILFPIHPRTKKKLTEFNLNVNLNTITNLRVCDPLNYNDFLLQICKSNFVITDSGGIQEETSYLGIPCFTIRKNTERPITITKGTNKLVNIKEISKYLKSIKKKRTKIPKWDGKTSFRILKILKKEFGIK